MKGKDAHPSPLKEPPKRPKSNFAPRTFNVFSAADGAGGSPLPARGTGTGRTHAAPREVPGGGMGGAGGGRSPPRRRCRGSGFPTPAAGPVRGRGGAAVPAAGREDAGALTELPAPPLPPCMGGGRLPASPRLASLRFASPLRAGEPGRARGGCGWRSAAPRGAPGSARRGERGPCGVPGDRSARAAFGHGEPRPRGGSSGGCRKGGFASLFFFFYYCCSYYFSYVLICLVKGGKGGAAKEWVLL